MAQLTHTHSGTRPSHRLLPQHVYHRLQVLHTGPAAAAEPGAMQLQLEQQEAHARGGMDSRNGQPDVLFMGKVN
jgi:hypothetical protein